jgi:cytochrome c
MKKILITLTIFTALIACNSGGDKKAGENTSGDPKTTTASGDNKENGATADNPNSPEYQKGLELVAKDNCTTCHKIDGELIGPSYKQVAQKYQGASEEKITELAHTIMNGGKGNWGQTEMPPNTSLSEDDAKAMVRYILLLK